ncbi:Fic family protein, partial [Streptomyces iakyrus]|uniref:Fic family protein n=1 Tax=Streptomyces iakyrus TaxID=68219 RepID=UPI0036CB28DC
PWRRPPAPGPPPAPPPPARGGGPPPGGPPRGGPPPPPAPTAARPGDGGATAAAQPARLTKDGRERYGIGPGIRARLDACLAESARDAARHLPLTARAARAYLDVCFFHPFDDGNARAAFLTLVFVLDREGIALDGVSLLRRIAFSADEPGDPLVLASYIDTHLTETRRRAAALA